jgi:hypothetical protein
VTHTIINRTGLLLVDSQPLKRALGEAIGKCKIRLGRLIERQIEEEIEQMMQEFQ